MLKFMPQVLTQVHESTKEEEEEEAEEKEVGII